MRACWKGIIYALVRPEVEVKGGICAGGGGMRKRERVKCEYVSLALFGNPALCPVALKLIARLDAILLYYTRPSIMQIQ